MRTADDIAEFFRRRLVDAGYEYRDLALKLGVSAPLAHAILKGGRKITLRQLDKVAEALGESLGSLFTERDLIRHPAEVKIVTAEAEVAYTGNTPQGAHPSLAIPRSSSSAGGSDVEPVVVADTVPSRRTFYGVRVPQSTHVIELANFLDHVAGEAAELSARFKTGVGGAIGEQDPTPAQPQPRTRAGGRAVHRPPAAKRGVR